MVTRFERGDWVEHPRHGAGQFVRPGPFPGTVLAAFAGAGYDFNAADDDQPNGYELVPVAEAELTNYRTVS